MWIPQSEPELRDRAEAGDLVETATFDGKRELPQPGKNLDLAVDVAAMSTDGGVLVYGLDEDEHGRLTILRPIPLAGARERLDAVRQTAISEPPDVIISEIPAEGRDGEGYLVVAVPASPRAPHMVTLKAKNQFYGRGETGNRPLSEGDVARLYARRDRWEQDAGARLDELVADAPIGQSQDLVYLHVFVKPLTSPPDTTRRAVGGDAVGEWVHRHVRGGGLSYSSHSLIPEGWEFTAGFEDPEVRAERVQRMRIHEDGEMSWFEARMGVRDPQDDVLKVFEKAVAEKLTAMLGSAHHLYGAAGYVGQVDVGMAVTNVEGAVSNLGAYGPFYAKPYPRSDYRRTVRVSATALAEPRAVGRLVAAPFLGTVNQGERDPFAKQTR